MFTAPAFTDYTIKRTPKGFTLWTFRDWTRPKPGWRPLSDHTTEDEALQKLEEHLGLREKPKAVVATLTVTDYFMWGGP